HHRAAMAAEHEGADILDRDAELFGEEIAEAGAVEHSGHADNASRGQPASLAHHPNHDVERVGDRDHKGLRAMFFDGGADRADDFSVGLDQIVAAHPRLARDTGSDDDDIGAFDIGIVVAAFDHRVVALDRRALHDV